MLFIEMWMYIFFPCVAIMAVKIFYIFNWSNFQENSELFYLWNIGDYCSLIIILSTPGELN